MCCYLFLRKKCGCPILFQFPVNPEKSTMIVAKEHGCVTLECKATGAHNLIWYAPKIYGKYKEWKRNFFDNGEIFSETLTISTLKISNIDRKAAGSYECVAKFF